MKLTNKISLILFFAWVVMITLFYFGSQRMILKNFSVLENQTMNTKVYQAQSALLQESKSVESITRNWAIWNTAYRLIDNSDKRAMMSLLSLRSFQSIDIDYALFLDANNKIIYSAGTNRHRTALVNVPEQLITILKNNNALTHKASFTSSSKGLVSIDQGILLIAAHVLTGNNGNGSIKGYLVIGKYLTNDILEKISNRINADVSIISVQKNKIAKENSTLLKQLSANVNMPLLNQNHRIYAYSFLNDVNGRPVAILKIESPRSIYQLGLNTFKYSNLIIFLYSFVITLILWVILQCLIAKRIEKLSNQFTLSNNHNGPIKSESGKFSDEISTMSTLYQQATHDPLTGLANRNLLYQAFKYHSELSRDPTKKIVILYIDIDHFKKINYTLGLDIGDQALAIIAKRLTTSLRENDLASRLGSDEFVVMLNDLQKDRVKLITNRIFKNINRPIIHNGHEIQISASIGVCIYPDDGNSIETLIKQADMALDYAKAHGRHHYQFYSVSLRKSIDESYQKEIDLQYAIDENQLCLYYQPIFDIKTKEINSLEALIRWNHPEYGVLGSDEIIPIAEKTELIQTIGRWLFKEVCSQVKKWQDANLPVVPVAVNVSAAQMREASLSEVVNKTLRLSSLDPRLLQIEITETGFLDITDSLLKDLETLKSIGIKLTIDDFGTGYSSLAYLKKLPISKLKIDQSFIRDIQTDAGDKAITLAIIAIAHQLNLKVTAEGVENEEQYNFLRFHQTDEVQGFYLCKPLTVKECEKLLSGKIPDKKNK